MQNKINSKYLPIIESDTRYYVITGGRGSGKSFSVSAILAGMTFTPGIKILFTRYTMVSAHISIIPEFSEKIELMNARGLFQINQSEIVNTATKSDIIFKGIKTSSGNQTAALKSIKGITTWVLDEAEELVEESTFDKIDESIRVKGKPNKIILILNPTTKEHWIYKRFFEEAGVEPGANITKGNTTYIHTDYRDNEENLSESFLQKIEDLKERNPIKYRHRILGGWLDRAEGVVFTNWAIGEVDTTVPVIYGLDFGFSIDPTALVEVRVDNKRATIYAKVLVYKERLSTTDIRDELRAAGVGHSLVIADSAEPRLISELKQAGFNIQETKKETITAGLALMQNYKIVVSECSAALVRELNNYTWHSRKGGVPIDDWNHAIDAVRYVVVSLAQASRKNKSKAYGNIKDKRAGFLYKDLV
jgi:phage terminase large subunit